MSVSSLAPLLRLRLNSEPRVKKTREEGLCRRVFVPLQDKELLSLTRILHPLRHFSARSGAILGALEVLGPFCAMMLWTWVGRLLWTARTGCLHVPPPRVPGSGDDLFVV